MNNIVFKVTNKYMKLNRRRTAITFIGIVFMVMLMTCVFAGRETVMGYMRSVAELDKGSWHVIAYDLTKDEAETIAARDDIEKVSYSEALGVMDLPQTGNAEKKPFLEVKAYSPDSFGMVNITMAEGRIPENENEIIISETAMTDGADIKIGDKISGDIFTRTITSKYEKGDGGTTFPFEGIDLPFGETIEVPDTFMSYSENESYYESKVPKGFSGDYTVVGIMHAPNFEKSSSAGYPAVTVLDEQKTDTVNMFMVFDLDKVNAFYEIREEIDSVTSGDTKFETNELLLAFSAKGDDSNITKITIFIEVFFTVLIMAASMILIYNVFNMSFAERAKYLGMLTAVGATGRQKRQSIYYECFILLIPALPFGILTGMGVIKGAMQLLKPQLDKLIDMIKFGVYTDVPVKLSFGLTEAALIVGMCMLTVMLSALIPAVKIGKVGAVESIRGNLDKTKKKRFRTKKALLEKGRPELLLAVNSTKRSKHLTKSIVRSISVFAVLTMVTLYGAQSVIRLMDIMSEEEGWSYVPDNYEYYVAGLSHDDDRKNSMDIIEQLLEDEAVTDKKKLMSVEIGPHIKDECISDEYNAAFKELFFQYTDNTEEKWDEMYGARGGIWPAANIIVADDEDYAFLAGRGEADMDIVSDTSKPSLLLYTGINISTDYYCMGSELKGYKCIEVDKCLKTEIGGEVVFQGYNRKTESEAEQAVTLAGYVDNDAVREKYDIKAFSPFMFMNRSGFEQLKNTMECHSSTIYIFSVEDESEERLVSTISDICESTLNDPDSEEMIIGDYADRNTGMNIKQVISAIIRILAYCFTGLVSVVCMLNLYNSIKGRAAERTKETAMLRSMGMTDKQLSKMRDIENLMLLRNGLVIAAVICTTLCLALNYFLTSYFGRVRLEFPWLLALCIPVVIGAVSSLLTKLSYRSADRISIVEEIRCETV